MGKNEFYAWVDQLYREVNGPQRKVDSWDNWEGDTNWQDLHAKREALRGR